MYKYMCDEINILCVLQCVSVCGGLVGVIVSLYLVMFKVHECQGTDVWPVLTGAAHDILPLP